MFRFASPEYFYLLLLLPLFYGILIYAKIIHRKRLAAFGNIVTLKRLMPEASWSKVRNKFVVITLAFAILVVALARPQLGSKLKEVKKKGVELMLVVDVSNSMMAEDFKPSRLERTKYAINSLLDQFIDDRIGLVVFAGRPFVQLPITSDYTAAKSFVSYVSPGMIDAQGTDIGAALELAGRSFSSQSDKNRAIILISDGENHDGNPDEVARQLGEQGIIVSTIGIGTPEGSPITIGGEMMKDEKGEIIVSKLNEEMMKSVAHTAGGSYVRATNGSLGLKELVDQIKSLETAEFKTEIYDEYNELYQYFVGLALILLVLEFSVLERRNRVISRMKIFNIEDKE